MMPFSVLRTWGLGLVGWVLLGLGVYCVWQWSDHRDRLSRMPIANLAVRDHNEGEVDRIAAAETAAQDRAAEEQAAMWFLIAGVSLLGFSFFGFVPATLLLGRPGDSPPEVPPGKSIEIEGPADTKLHLTIYGTDHGPTLVFTHGWSLDSRVWDFQLALAKRFQVVVWDLPGLGASRGPSDGDYSLDRLAHNLSAVIAAAGDGPVVLVGHSLGGMITQTFCRLFPEQIGTRVAGIVLLHTTYTNPLRTAFLAPLWTALERPLIVPLNYLNIWLAPLAFLSNLQSFLNGSLHVTTRISSFSGKQSWSQLWNGASLAVKAWPSVVGRGNLAMLEFNEESVLTRVDIPVLVIAARHDRMTQPFASEHLASKLPLGALSLADAGHLGFWEAPTTINELLLDFAHRLAGGEQGAAPARKGGSTIRA